MTINTKHQTSKTKNQKPNAKHRRYKAKRKAQSVLESTLAYAAGMAILGAAWGIWGWGNAHIPARQVTYEATRVIAGTPRMRNVDKRGAKPSFSMSVAGGGMAGF